MFKKKHSEINIKVPLKPYYPLRSKSPISALPSPRNLSPMKNTFRNLHSKTQKTQLRQEIEPRNLSPCNFENHFQSHILSRAHYNDQQYDSTHRFPASKFGLRTEFTNDMSYVSKYSHISRENSHNQTIKESKRLFTKCIAEMNSEKKKVCGERSQNNSNNTSVVQNSKHVISDSKLRNIEPAPVTSFKALKIQMIESFLPSDKKCNTFDRKNSEYDTSTGRQYKTREFLIDEPKKQQIIELFNQSFSNAGVSRIIEQQANSKLCVNLQAKAKILQSLYVEQESDYTDFDLIMQKVQMQPVKQKVQEIEQSVKISMQSERGSLTMDPFY